MHQRVEEALSNTTTVTRTSLKVMTLTTMGTLMLAMSIPRTWVLVLVHLFTNSTKHCNRLYKPQPT